MKKLIFKQTRPFQTWMFPRNGSTDKSSNLHMARASQAAGDFKEAR